MKKYFQLAKLTFQEYFVYRLNFVLWRFRSFVFFLTLLLFWLAIYGDRIALLGYERAKMLAYVVGVAFLRSFVLGSRSAGLAGQIRSGELTKILLCPIGMFSFWLTRDAVDKLLNLFFTFIEIGIAVSFLRIPFYFPQRAETYLFFALLLVLALFLYFFISFFLSAFAFWTEEIWATRWLFGIIFLEFFAGAYFPIDVLPIWLQRVINLTPFPYLVFFPIKIWLEQLSMAVAIKGIFICFCWLILFYWLSRSLWQKGAKNYGAFGG